MKRLGPSVSHDDPENMSDGELILFLDHGLTSR